MTLAEAAFFVVIMWIHDIVIHVIFKFVNAKL